VADGMYSEVEPSVTTSWLPLFRVHVAHMFGERPAVRLRGRSRGKAVAERMAVAEGSLPRPERIVAPAFPSVQGPAACVTTSWKIAQTWSVLQLQVFHLFVYAGKPNRQATSRMRTH
jgi:hypothetical protein